jgi:hypothetical protein
MKRSELTSSSKEEEFPNSPGICEGTNSFLSRPSWFFAR